VHRDRGHKLDSFKPAIAELLDQDSTISVALIEQRLRAQGFDGGMTIVKDYVRTLRKSTAFRRAYVRMEPAPGDRFGIYGATSAHWIMPAHRASFTPSVWCNATAASSTSSSPIARASKLSCVATYTPSRRWPASLASFPTILCPGTKS
jgi:hypothetical protein